MKKIAIIMLFSVGLAFSVQQAAAQYVSVRIGFPGSVRVAAPGARPYPGAVWIAPEWQWRGGRYYSVPGYWARPHRHHATWQQGYWKQTRRGYYWVPGRWR